ncbi:hypothetical protein LEN26_003371 [Aphanomyces euteiches]|nr:hypothetical protein LEN26_003371 [Aphanomyces euteiches]
MASKASQEEALRQMREECAAYQARAHFAQLRPREDESFGDDDARHGHENKGVKRDVSKFSGKESDHVMRWLLQVTIAADALCIRKESIKVAFAMSHLKGRAEAWAYSLRMGNPNCFPTLEDFASQLKKAFLPPNSDFRNRSRFLNAAQGKQTIREFVHELRYLYASMNDERSLPESTRVTVFMNGLNKGPARTELFRRYPETFDEAVSIALSEDFSQNLARASASDSMDMDISSMGQIPQRDQAGQPSPDKRCYECKQPGHFARNCPRRSDSRRRDMSPRRSQSHADSSSFPGRKRQHPVGARRPAGAELGLPFDRGGNTIAEGLASGTLLCQIGLHSKMLSFGIPMPGFPRTLKVLIDCGASENYARKESMMMNKEKLEEAVAKSDGRATVRVKMADGSVAEQPRVLITLPTRVGQFVSDETYFVIDLDERWDLILGMGWLEKHQPTINWKLKTISKSLDANKALGLVSNEPTPNETKSPRRVTLAVEGLATHGHDIALMKAADG